MWAHLRISALLTLVLAVIAHSAYNQWNNRNSFKLWRADGKELIETYRGNLFFCNNVKDRKNLTKDEESKLLQYNDTMINKNLRFANTYAELGLLVNDKAYKAAKELICWADYVSEARERICTMDLKDKGAIDAWADNIIHQIDLNIEEQKQPINMVKNWILSFTSDPRSSIRSKSVCKIDEISKNIDSKFGK